MRAERALGLVLQVGRARRLGLTSKVRSRHFHTVRRLTVRRGVDRRLRSQNAYCYPLLPPTSDDVMTNLVELGVKETLYRDPYYSNWKDAPKRPREYAGRLFHLKEGTGVGSLPEWAMMDDWWDEQDDPEDEPVKRVSPTKRGIKAQDDDDKPKVSKYPLIGKGVTGWQYAGGACPRPPSRKEVLKWLEDTDGIVVQEQKKRMALQSQVGSLGSCGVACLITNAQLLDPWTNSEEQIRIWLKSARADGRVCPGEAEYVGPCRRSLW